MKWQGRERSSNIEDRRGQGNSGGGLGGLGGGFGQGSNPFGRGGFRVPTGRSGGGIGGIVMIVIILVIAMAFGFNPLSLIDGNGGIGNGSSSSYSDALPPPKAGEDQLADFVSVVVKDTETFWTEVFKQNNQTYTPPKVVLFSGQTQSACGAASAETGPFYCPNDRKVYIDLAFYDQLRQQFGAPGDFAQAYVIAHEVGHHIQNLTGVLPDFNERRQSMSQDEANAYSVRVELQADCYAGVWANYEGSQNVLDSGDFEEAMNAANKIGDDTLMREMGGRVVPRNFTHGTSAQRQKWFNTGYKSGDVGQCDTLSGAI